MELKRFERNLMWRTRLITLVAVLASFAGSILMLYLGLKSTYLAFATQFYMTETPLPRDEAAVINLIGALDRFLIAIVLMYFGFGIYVLFVRPGREAAELGLPRSLHVGRIGQLKQTLAEVIMVVLFVLFLRVSLETFSTPEREMSWMDMAKYLLLPVSIALLAISLRLVQLHPKPERPQQPDSGRRLQDDEDELV